MRDVRARLVDAHANTPPPSFLFSLFFVCRLSRPTAVWWLPLFCVYSLGSTESHGTVLRPCLASETSKGAGIDRRPHWLLLPPSCLRARRNNWHELGSCPNTNPNALSLHTEQGSRVSSRIMLRVAPLRAQPPHHCLLPHPLLPRGAAEAYGALSRTARRMRLHSWWYCR